MVVHIAAGLSLTQCADLDVIPPLPEAEQLPPSPAPLPRCGEFASVTAPIRIVPAFGDLRFELPTRVLQPRWPGAPFYVLQLDGLIWRVSGSGFSASATLFADLRGRVDYPFDRVEGGLLGMTFSPNFETTKEVFLSYTAHGNTPNFRRVVTRMKSLDGGVTLDPSTEEIVLDIERQYTGHNGGAVAFGADGYLYVALGDGHFGDPEGNAQNPNVLLGKILRLDISKKPYAIPPDNPFVGHATARPEIFALGFRNPWSFSIDSATGDLWTGDVGQSDWEEINLITKGGNYGWNIREGTHCFGAALCSNPNLIDPVFEYSHNEGAAVTGGLVYRGKALPELEGRYVYGDYGLGTISVLDEDSLTKRYSGRLLLDTEQSISSMAEDADGEMYFVDIFAERIFRIERNDAPAASPPSKLTETGCVDRSDPTKLAPELIPYEVNVPFWSDGVDKERAFALPNGARIVNDNNGFWTFPPGSVALKTFSTGGRRFETRLLVNHPGVGWAGYSYEWNDAQTEALLLDGAKDRTIGDVKWTYPSRTECSFCHTSAAGHVIGIHSKQLNREVPSGKGTSTNQLTLLNERGLFEAPIDPQTAEKLVPPSDDNAPIELRARSWLHANCAYCHQPHGPGQGPPDFRVETADPHLCNIEPYSGNLGVTGAKLITPYVPELSMVFLRATRRGPGQMPPLGSKRVDPAGEAILREWIGTGKACP